MGRCNSGRTASISRPHVLRATRHLCAFVSQKPFRDWLEVLNCCLGFYTWEFGKLKLGCRINASAVDAYTLANSLFQSLRLTPIQAGFEHLVLSFADVAYQYQANTAEYCDKSHAAYYGRAGSPLTSQMHSVGCSTLSQALRIAATRTREEIGGVNYAEWRDARAATWQTRLLGLGNEVGSRQCDGGERLRRRPAQVADFWQDRPRRGTTARRKDPGYQFRDRALQSDQSALSGLSRRSAAGCHDIEQS
jgi:hypothetical protein